MYLFEIIAGVLKGISSCISLSNVFKSKSNIAVIQQISDIVCYNQGELAQYTYLAGEKHKLMKEEFKKGKANNTKVQSHQTDLVSYLSGELKSIIEENFGRVRKYFIGRSKQLPRVCIKVSKDDIIKDFIREDNRRYISDCKWQDNTGFADVYETGRYYLCNNIPHEVRACRYKNPRLDSHKATLYKKISAVNWLSQKCGKEDKAWMDCWTKNSFHNVSTVPNASECYKSTLIIPMTLLGNRVSNDFKKRFRIADANENTGRAIYGFLCFDHHYTNFFKREIDVPIGYIFADLISLYLITHLMYTEYSKTFREVGDFVEGKSSRT
ncbi:MAG: hypothetical protein WC539_05070 [Nitrospirota bacterium]